MLFTANNFIIKGYNVVPVDAILGRQQHEVGIYKRKQESKKTRKQELDQESDQETKKVFPFFLGRQFLVEFLFSFFVFLFS